jgi:hypothetical protein
MQPKDLKLHKRCRLCKNKVTLVFLKSYSLGASSPYEDYTENRYEVLYKIPLHWKGFLRLCKGSHRIIKRRMVILHDNQAHTDSFRFIKQRRHR